MEPIPVKMKLADPETVTTATDADIEAEQEVDHILRARPGNLRFMPLAQRSDT